MLCAIVFGLGCEGAAAVAGSATSGAREVATVAEAASPTSATDLVPATPSDGAPSGTADVASAGEGATTSDDGATTSDDGATTSADGATTSDDGATTVAARGVAPPSTRAGPAATSTADAAAERAPRSRRAVERSERALRALLATAPIASVERGHGGRSLAFRVTLEDGTRAYFKPEQTFSGTHWYAEIAAYHLDRELGLDRAPVVVGRRVPWSVLEEAADDDARIPEIIVAEDGTVRGAMVAWIEERLVPLRAPLGWERWVRIDAPSAITPFQNARAWHRARATLPDPDELEARDEPLSEPPADDAADRSGGGDDERTDAAEPDAARPDAAQPDAMAPDTPGRPAELSDLVVFDYLVHNVDRWSANSTNVRTRGTAGPLVFLDQAAGFSRRRARLTLMDERLCAVQRFRRRTIDAVRALDLEDYAAALDRDPLAPLLEARQLEHLAERRQALLDHVDALVAEHGEETVYAW